MDWRGIIVAVLGLYDLYLIITRTRKLNARRAWPKTVGIISQGHINETSDGERTYRSAVFIFTYKVSETEHQGRFVLGRGLGGLSLSKAEKALAQQSVGSAIPVHYNPEKPQETFTEFDDKDFSNYVLRLWLYLFLLIPFSFIFFGLLSMFIK